MKANKSSADLKGLLPIFVRLRGRRILLVGGGAMATLRAKQYLKAGALLTVVSPEASPQLRRLAKTRALTWLKRDFVSRDVSRKYFMIVGATDKARVQAAISKAAESKGLLYNVVDAPAHCNFITPAVVERGDLKIAISTLGKSPGFSGALRNEIDIALPHSAADWTKVLGRLRKSLKMIFPGDLKRQKALLEYFLAVARKKRIPAH